MNRWFILRLQKIYKITEYRKREELNFRVSDNGKTVFILQDEADNARAKILLYVGLIPLMLTEAKSS